jgi:hypothetical protein
MLRISLNKNIFCFDFEIKYGKKHKTGLGKALPDKGFEYAKGRLKRVAGILLRAEPLLGVLGDAREALGELHGIVKKGAEGLPVLDPADVPKAQAAVNKLADAAGKANKKLAGGQNPILDQLERALRAAANNPTLLAALLSAALLAAAANAAGEGGTGKKHAAPTNPTRGGVGPEDTLVRRGTSPESARRLETQATAAENAGTAQNGVPFGHGVSVTTPESNARLAKDPADAVSATRRALEDAGFEVRHTPSGANLRFAASRPAVGA